MWNKQKTTKLSDSKNELESMKDKLNSEHIVQWLKSILWTLVILTYKVAQFHWNMKWDKFLYIHPKFWDLYVSIFEQQDVIAERIRQLWEKPLTSLSESIKLSVIDENEDEWVTPDEAVKITLEDFKWFNDLLEAFNQKISSDLSTQQLVIDLQLFYSQQIFLLESEL